MGKYKASDTDRLEKNTTSSQQKTLSLKNTALSNGMAQLRFWLVSTLGLALDLSSKAWAQNALIDAQGHNQPIVLIDEYLRFYLRYNAGAAFGLAQGSTVVLIIGSIVTVGLLFWFFATTRADQSAVHIGLAMLLAGALGNLYDRLFHSGLVVDFIEVNLHFPPANPWPTFNLADVLLCLGVAIILLGLRRHRNP